jgi:hypothetical protein
MSDCQALDGMPNDSINHDPSPVSTPSPPSIRNRVTSITGLG